MARRQRSSSKSTKQQTRKPHVAAVPGTVRAHVGETFARGAAERLPQSGLHTDTGAMPLLELDAQSNTITDVTGIVGAGMLDLALEVVGAEHLTLQQHLALWQREQERLVNRGWRRPGGLARPASLVRPNPQPLPS